MTKPFATGLAESPNPLYRPPEPLQTLAARRVVDSYLIPNCEHYQGDSIDRETLWRLLLAVETEAQAWQQSELGEALAELVFAWDEGSNPDPTEWRRLDRQIDKALSRARRALGAPQ